MVIKKQPRTQCLTLSYYNPYPPIHPRPTKKTFLKAGASQPPTTMIPILTYIESQTILYKSYLGKGVNTGLSGVYSCVHVINLEWILNFLLFHQW